jgi:16S rRNA (cytosine967-C5)-methyltransferase
MKQNSRAIAAIILTDAINNNHPLNQTLSKYKHKTATEHALVQALCYGVMRHYLQLKFIVGLLLTKPLAKKDLLIQHLIYIGLFQLIHMRIPDHAAIFETVAATKQFKKPWMAKLVNGTLRTFQREQESILTQASTDLEASTTHPRWLLQNIQQNWPEYYQRIIDANNDHPPTSLRVNLQHCSLNMAKTALEQKNMQPSLIADTIAGLITDTKEDLTLLKEFSTGMFSIQDGAAQLAAQLLELQPQQIVLDACAAPGGKTCHMLEQEPTIKLTALDKSPVRIKLIAENIKRLNLSMPTLKIADATQIDAWWDNVLFDRILIDAPCSATGIIRRQPDIKLFRTPEDIEDFHLQQNQLLTNLWPLLKPGGILLYATCSILPQENEQLLAQFISKHNDVAPKKIDITTGIKLAIGRQILPGQNNMDGFYYAKLQKMT